MVLGLFNIARQAIQRELTQGGILLGLLGVEKSLSTVVFLFSPEFRAALKYGFSSSGGPQKRIRHMVGVIFVVCSLCTVVGPSSYVMVVPKFGWFEDKPLKLSGAAYTYGSRCYPYIMINPALGTLEGTNWDHFNNAIFASPFPTYNFWQSLENADSSASVINGVGRLNNKTYHNMMHHHKNWGIQVTANTSWPVEPREVSDPWRDKFYN